MDRCTEILSILCLFFTITPVAHGQMGNPGQPAAPGSATGRATMDSNVPMHGSPGGASVVVSVFAEKDEKHIPLDRQAVIKFYDETRKSTTWQTTISDTSEATFVDLAFGKYEIEVSAVGYVSGHSEADIINLFTPTKVKVVLHPDPAATDLDAANAPLPAKANKEVRHAISYLKSGNLPGAEKQLDAAYKLAPDNAQVNFLLGYLYLQKKDLDGAQTSLIKATTLDPHGSQALDLLGRVYLVRRDYGQAQKILEQATAADPEDWMAHNLLSDAYLNQQSFDKALTESDLALERGRRKGAYAPQIVKGEALADLGSNLEAIQELRSYLQHEPNSASLPRVRDLILMLEHRDSNASAITAEPVIQPKAGEEDVLLAATASSLTAQNWAPPGIDDAQPVVAAGVACPYQEVIEKSGDRVKELVDNVARFSAIEDLLHQRLDAAGNPTSKEEIKFDYVASISEQRTGILAVDELRSGHYGPAELPDQIVTNGFPALALVFHPDMRDNFEMKCEGLGSLHGQATWLIHFRQRQDRPKHIQDYIVQNEIYSVDLKGRAWVSADNFQILRIESELIDPIPQIKLLAEHQITEYGPVTFPRKQAELWLPKSAEVYLYFGRQRYYRRHTFDHFMLFSVDSSDKTPKLSSVHGPGSLSRRKRKRWHA